MNRKARSQQTKDVLAEVHRRQANNYTGLSCRNNPLYRIFNTMMQRCVNPKARYYSSYGGRGIRVCDRWLEKDGQGFRNFMTDMGERPPAKYPRTGFSVYRLSRTNTNGDFCPNNCLWATRQTKFADMKPTENVLLPLLVQPLRFQVQERREIAWKLSAKYGWRCWYCSIPLTVPDSRPKMPNASLIVRQLELHLDHIVPKVAGGSDDISNLSLSCECCNRAKGNLNVSYFLAWLDRVRFAEVWTPIKDGRRSRMGMSE